MAVEPVRTLTIFIPVYNEELILSNLFKSLNKLCDDLNSLNINADILFHDNASTDSSWNLIFEFAKARNNVKAFRFSRNIGYQQSLTLSFKHSFSDGIVVYQSDMQDPICLIVEFVKAWISGHKVVVGVATNRSEKFLETLGRKFFLWLFKSSADLRQINWFTDFYLLDKSIYSQFANLPFSHQFIRGRLVESNVIDLEIDYCREKRKLGESKFNFAKKYSLAFDAILLHGTRLIRRITIFGFGVSVLLFPLMIANFYFKIWTSLLLVFFIFLDFLIIGLIGLVLEYLIRVYARLQSPEIVPISTILNNESGEFK